MPANDGTLTPQLGGGGEPLPLVDDPDPYLSDNLDVDTVGAEIGSILVKEADGVWRPNNILNQGLERQILVQQSDTPLDFAWETLFDNRILPMAQVCVDYKYTKVNETTVRWDDIDLTYTFPVGRTVSIQSGTTYSIGEIQTSVYAAGDTTITLTMSQNTIPADMDVTCAMGSTDSWQTVTDTDPAAGANLTAIAVNRNLGVTTWLIGTAQGDIYRSIDSGNTWTRFETFITGGISVIHWHEFYQAWYIGSTAGDIRYSLSDGQTWLATVNNPGDAEAVAITSIEGGQTGSLNAGNYVYFNMPGSFSPTYRIQWHQTVDFSDAVGWHSTVMYPHKMTYNPLALDIEVIHRANGSTYKDVLGRLYSSVNYALIDSTWYNPITSFGHLHLMMASHGRLSMSNDGAGTYNLHQTTDTAGAASVLNNPIDYLFNGAKPNGMAFSNVVRVAVIVGDNGQISYSPDYGVTWFNVPNAFGTENINAVARSEDDGKFIAVGNGGIIAQSLTGLF